MQHVLVIVYQRFGTASWSYLKRSSKLSTPWQKPEISQAKLLILAYISPELGVCCGLHHRFISRM